MVVLLSNPKSAYMKTSLHFSIVCLCTLLLSGQIWAATVHPVPEEGVPLVVMPKVVISLEEPIDNEWLSMNMGYLECDGDPLAFPWMQTLISSLVANYCDSCLTISQALWNDVGVIEVNWNAGNCGFTDLGFWTVYSCNGDTLQHCETTIAGLTCTSDSIVPSPEDLTVRDTIWKCAIPECSISNDAILCQPWLVDSLVANFELCEVFCIEGNSGNFVYRHNLNGKELIEFRTTCGEIRRMFYDCDGEFVFECLAFDFGFAGLCDSSTVPGLTEGELLWDCSQPIKATTSTIDDRVLGVRVFPTIFSNSLNISLDESLFKKILVSDAGGREVLRVQIEGGEMMLDTGDWTSGTYFLTFFGDQQKSMRKVQKIR